MEEGIICFASEHNVKCVELGDHTWIMTGGVQLYDPQNPDLSAVNDFTGGSYPTKDYCEVDRIVELNRYEFVRPTYTIEFPPTYLIGSPPNKQQQAQRPRAESQKSAEIKSNQQSLGSADSKAEPNNAERPNYTEPSKETPSGVTPDQNIVDKIESGIQETFRPGHEGVQLLKEQLEDDTDASNWIANAAIATGLDVLDFAMGMVEGIPLGILDTRNIGEGLAEGTWEGC